MTLRPTSEQDRELLFAVASDRLLWELHPAHDRWQRPVFEAFFDDGLRSCGALTVIDSVSGMVAGATRFGLNNEDRGEIEIGWTYLARKYWGGPGNSEMKRLMIDHVRGEVSAVTFVVGVANFRSRRALEKLGACLRPGTQTRTMAGRQVEHVTYAIAMKI